MSAVPRQPRTSSLASRASGLASGAPQIQVPDLPRRQSKHFARAKTLGEVACKSPIARAAKAILGAGSAVADPGSPISKAAVAARKVTSAVCKSLMDAGSPVAGAAGRALGRKACSRRRKTCSDLQPLSAAAIDEIGCEPSDADGQAQVAALPRAGRRNSRRGTTSGLTDQERARLQRQYEEYEDSMTSSFVRLVYKKAKSIHEQRTSFQARVNGDGPRCPALIFRECVNDIKHSIRICRVAQSFIDMASVGVQNARETTENSKAIERSDPVEIPDSAWSDLLNCLSGEGTPKSCEVSPSRRSNATESISPSRSAKLGFRFDAATSTLHLHTVHEHIARSIQGLDRI